MGYLPRAICTADFNGDSIPDLATTNTGPGTVSVLLGDGIGGFNTDSSFGTGIFNNASRICAADFNKDGKADLVITTGYNYALLALGNGNGSFAAPVQIPVANSTHAIISADFNSDTIPDLAITTNGSSSQISVLPGNGSGGFAAAANFAVDTAPQALTTGDFNGDGYLDIASANMKNNITGNISVLLGNSTGSFGAATNFALGDTVVPQSLYPADFDADGKMDMAVACVSNNSNGIVAILSGNGAGSFGAPVNFAVDSYPAQVIAAHLNADGKPDLAIITSKSNIDIGQVSVLLNCNTTDVAVDAPEAANFMVYPNPTNGNFKITGAAGMGQVCICNIAGQVVYNTFKPCNEIPVHLTTAGIYFITIATQGKTAAKKLIVYN